MALRDEIQTIRDGAIKALDDAHDYFFHSAATWRTLQKVVKENGLTFSIRNDVTGSEISQDALMQRGQVYVANELTSATLQQFVSIFESFLYDILRAWLLAYPQALSSRQLSGKEILPLADKAAVVDALIEKELRDIFYDRPANWFAYLKERVKIGVPTLADAEAFGEIKATRDVLVHGQGVANAYYADKAGALARVKIGEVLDVAQPYHQASWELMRKLVMEISGEMAGKV